MGGCQSTAAAAGGTDADNIGGTGRGTLHGTEHAMEAARETFTKAVETMESTMIDFGNIFNRDKDNDIDKLFKRRAEDAREAGRRLKDVFAAPLIFDDGYVPPVHVKTAEEAAFIADALKNNFVFEHRSEREKKLLIDAFENFTAKKGKRIIKQGEAVGDYFYIIQYGAVKFVKDGNTVGMAGVGGSFGELALLYNCPRAASVVATELCGLWRLDQNTFKRILAGFDMKGDDETTALLRKVDFLKDADDDLLSKMAGAFHLKTFEAGESVAQKGSTMKEFCLIKKGKIKATDLEFGGRKYDDLELVAGECFGERAILKNEPYGGNVVATEKTELLCISKEAFDKLFGDWENIILKGRYKKMLKIIPIDKPKDLTDDEYGRMAGLVEMQDFRKGHRFFTEGKSTHGTLYFLRTGKVVVKSKDGETTVSGGGYFGEDNVLDTDKQTGNVDARSTAIALEDCNVGVLTLKDARSIIGVDRKNRPKIAFDDLKKHRILGAGTFGKVWLVSRKGTKEAYALKIQIKRQLIEHHQAEGVIREKDVMAQLDSPFIISLAATYQDETSIYMLTKLYQGGELWSIIHTNDRDGLPESAAKFYMAGILEGLTHMHTRNIIYRDLKGENVLLDSDGYTVIIDLGFAKVIKDKTYTFCGTPLYLAPEIIMQKGHDKGADHWSWGVLVYESIIGSTPFYEKNMDQMTLFKTIIKGKVVFPEKGMSTFSKDLIRRMLVVRPRERLGSFVGAADDIKRHPWFKDIDWEQLANKGIEAPWKPDIKDALDVSNFDNWDHLDKKPEKQKTLTAKEQEMFGRF